MSTSESEVWINDYTTGAGVQVAGHWRRRTPSATTDDDPDTGPMMRVAAVSGAGTGPPASSDPVGVAQARYQAAQIGVGVSAIRQRRGKPTDHQAAVAERAAARADLEVARQQTDPGTPAAASDPAPGTSGQEDGQRCPSCGQYQGPEHQCPTPAGLPAGDYAGLSGNDRVEAMVADLDASVRAVVESGQLHRWLDAMASNGLNRWSANNQFLAIVQMVHRGEPIENLHMMGFQQWKELNRHVSKGAKAVWILAPVTRTIVEADDAGHTTEQRRVVGFRSVPVFNISDTDGQPLPAPPARPAAGAATPGTLDGLRDRVAAAGYTYSEEEIPGAAAGYTYSEEEIPGANPITGEGTLGYTAPRSKQIVVDSRLDDAQKASTIAHELGHVHAGHVDGDYREYQHHRGRMETEAEMTAYLVNRSRGMSRDQVDAFSPGYIAAWSHHDPALMHAAVDNAARAYRTIISGPWPTTEGA